jgi:hypothetical protein
LRDQIRRFWGEWRDLITPLFEGPNQEVLG